MSKIDFQKYKRQNTIVTTIVMIIIFGVYLYSSSRAPYSNNVGIFIAPLVIFIIYGPLASFTYAIIRAFQLRVSIKENFWSFVNIVFEQVPRVFQISGLFGLIAIFIISVLGGPMVFEMILFPFWAVEFLF